MFTYPSIRLDDVEETLSAVNSLLMLNNNSSNLPGDYPPMRGTARVTPTISTPVYSRVTSMPTSTTNQQTLPTQTPASTILTSTSQSKDLITLVSNIVSSSKVNADKQQTTQSTTIPSLSGTPSIPIGNMRSHIEEVIEDVAKGAATGTTTGTTNTVTTSSTSSTMIDANTTIVDSNIVTSVSNSTGSSKATAIPPVLRDVMKTPCPATTNASATSGLTSETRNIFDSHRSSTSPLKTSVASTTTTNVSTTVTPSTAAASNIVRPATSKTSGTHKRVSTPKIEPTIPSVPNSLLQPYVHMIPPESEILAVAAAAAAHSNFPFQLFAPLPTGSSNPAINASTNLLNPSLSLESATLPGSAPTNSNRGSSATGHMLNNAFLNTIMSGQQTVATNNNAHSGEKTSRRYVKKSIKILFLMKSYCFYLFFLEKQQQNWRMHRPRPHRIGRHLFNKQYQFRFH